MDRPSSRSRTTTTSSKTPTRSNQPTKQFHNFPLQRRTGQEQAQPDQEQNHRPRRRKKARRDEEISDKLDSNSSSSDDTDAAHGEKPQLPFAKRKQKKTKEQSPNLKECQIIIKAVNGYREAGVSYLAREFGRLADKPINLPSVFIKDLL